MLARGESRDEALARADRAAELIRFRTADAEALLRRRTFLSFQPPAIGDEEIDAVAETLRSGWLTSGPRAEELERRFATMSAPAHGVALASGTAAMHLSLLAAGGRAEGDEVITTPITWPATANVIVHCGARPVFVDVRDADLNIDPEAVAAAVTRADEGDPSRPPRRPAVPTSTRCSRSACP